MLSWLHKKCLIILFGILSISTISSLVVADDRFIISKHNRLYIGGFGGEMFSNSAQISQIGTLFFPQELGGSQASFSHGRIKKYSTGFGGAQIGYECSKPSSGFECSGVALAPAAEMEAIFFDSAKKGHLHHFLDAIPEHEFTDSFKKNVSICFVNGVVSLKNSLFGASPYIGGGIGAARISLHNVKSVQGSSDDSEVPHFNSKQTDSAWTFAAQAKFGVRYQISESFHIFSEYRYVYVDSINYIFSSSPHSSHSIKSLWNVKLDGLNFNSFALGIQFDL